MNYPKGSICHMEIPAPDLEQARAFYGTVFGWSFEPMGDTYLLFGAGEGGGGLDADATPSTDGSVLVLAVPDVDACLVEIEAAGGRTLQGRTEIGGGHGFCAYFADPAGNKLGIWMPAG